MATRQTSKGLKSYFNALHQSWKFPKLRLTSLPTNAVVYQFRQKMMRCLSNPIENSLLWVGLLFIFRNNNRDWIHLKFIFYNNWAWVCFLFIFSNHNWASLVCFEIRGISWAEQPRDLLRHLMDCFFLFFSATFFQFIKGLLLIYWVQAIFCLANMCIRLIELFVVCADWSAFYLYPTKFPWGATLRKLTIHIFVGDFWGRMAVIRIFDKR